MRCPCHPALPGSRGEPRAPYPRAGLCPGAEQLLRLLALGGVEAGHGLGEAIDVVAHEVAVAIFVVGGLGPASAASASRTSIISSRLLSICL